jgi:alpha-1,2-mannosyltransferase
MQRLIGIRGLAGEGGDTETSPTRQALTHSLILLPPVFVAWVIWIGVTGHVVAVDFTTSYLPAARDLFHGSSPYVHTGFVYPPPAGWLAAPLLLLPKLAAGLVATAAAVAAVTVTVWLMGVRDWRCFAISFLWLPCYSVIQTGNVVIILALLCAAAWNWRDRALVSGTSVGLAIALKLIAAPLLLFFVVTRRWRAAAVSAATAVAITVVSWAPIGFAGMLSYPHLLGQLDTNERVAGYALRTLVGKSLGWSAAGVITAVVAVALVAAAVRFRREETTPFIISVALVLELSPIVHMYYFVLLLVAVPLAAQRMAPIWVAPLILWVGPAAAVGGPQQWQRAAVLLAVGAIFALTVAPRAWRSQGAPRPALRLTGP